MEKKEVFQVLLGLFHLDPDEVAETYHGQLEVAIA